jgi:hypothetical protein
MHRVYVSGSLFFHTGKLTDKFTSKIMDKNNPCKYIGENSIF